MPLAIEQLDVSSYDLIISSSHAVAKGILTGPNQIHISYVHSPIRYAWDLQHQYLQETGLDHGIKSWIARAILHYIRLWGVCSPERQTGRRDCAAGSPAGRAWTAAASCSRGSTGSKMANASASSRTSRAVG